LANGCGDKSLFDEIADILSIELGKSLKLDNVNLAGTRYTVRTRPVSSMNRSNDALKTTKPRGTGMPA
jgi:hypothetical protein